MIALYITLWIITGLISAGIFIWIDAHEQGYLTLADLVPAMVIACIGPVFATVFFLSYSRDIIIWRRKP